MHINEVERILRDSICGQEKRYEIKRYCDHTCCESDFVMLRDGLEYAYLKFDETGKMSRKAMGIHEERWVLLTSMSYLTILMRLFLPVCHARSIRETT